MNSLKEKLEWFKICKNLEGTIHSSTVFSAAVKGCFSIDFQRSFILYISREIRIQKSLSTERLHDNIFHSLQKTFKTYFKIFTKQGIQLQNMWSKCSKYMRESCKTLESVRFGGLIVFVRVCVCMHAYTCDVFDSTANVINTLPWEMGVVLIFQIKLLVVEPRTVSTGCF